MLVTRETDYAVRCVVYLARAREQVVSVSEISRNMQIPKSFLAKILQRLVREGIVESSRGSKGGFWLLKSPQHITLLDVLSAMQGVAPINTCAIDKRRCRMSAKCSVHPLWVDIRRDVEKRLSTQTIADLSTVRLTLHQGTCKKPTNKGIRPAERPRAFGTGSGNGTEQKGGMQRSAIEQE